MEGGTDGRCLRCMKRPARSTRPARARQAERSSRSSRTYGRGPSSPSRLLSRAASLVPQSHAHGRKKQEKPKHQKQPLPPRPPQALGTITLTPACSRKKSSRTSRVNASLKTSGRSERSQEQLRASADEKCISRVSRAAVAALTRVAHCPGQDRVRWRTMTRGTRTGTEMHAPLCSLVCGSGIPTSARGGQGTAQNSRTEAAGRKGYDDAEKEGRTAGLAGLSDGHPGHRKEARVSPAVGGATPGDSWGHCMTCLRSEKIS